MRVVYMGTPAIAVPALCALAAAGHQVVAVVTQPDRPRGRSGRPAPSPVKVEAMARGIPVLQPERVRDPEFLAAFRQIAPDVAVVMAFGQILPQTLLDIPKFGCINIHASLLPRYRGAAPINRAIADGATGTGLTTMQMDRGMDTGPMYLTAPCPIGPEDDAEDVTERLAALAGPLVVETLRRVAEEGLQPTPQDGALATHAPMLRKEEGEIDWRQPAVRIVNRVRAFVPWPGSATRYRDEAWKVTRAAVGELAAGGAPPGRILRVDGDSLLVAAGEDTTVRLLALQLPGKRPMAVRAFLNGHPVTPGVTLGEVV